MLRSATRIWCITVEHVMVGWFFTKLKRQNGALWNVVVDDVRKYDCIVCCDDWRHVGSGWVANMVMTYFYGTIREVICSMTKRSIWFCWLLCLSVLDVHIVYPSCARFCTLGFFFDSQYEGILVRMDSFNRSIKGLLSTYSLCTLLHWRAFFLRA